MRLILLAGLFWVLVFLLIYAISEAYDWLGCGGHNLLC